MPRKEKENIISDSPPFIGCSPSARETFVVIIENKGGNVFSLQYNCETVMYPMKVHYCSIIMLNLLIAGGVLAASPLPTSSLL